MSTTSFMNAGERIVDETTILIRRILAGESELYYKLISPYQRVVYVCALSLLHNEAEAEDCAQDAFLKAYENLAEFKGESKFSSWLIRIALNEAKMRIRKLRPEKYESLDKAVDLNDGEYMPQTLGDWREIPSEALERKEVRMVIENAVKTLPKIYREVFILRDVQNLNVAAAAEILGVSEGVIKTRLLRARMQMRDLLAPAIKNSRVFSRPGFKKGTNPWL